MIELEETANYICFHVNVLLNLLVVMLVVFSTTDVEALPGCLGTQ